MLKRTGILFILLLLCGSCAQQGSPSGGPRDEDPPVIVESDPPNYSLHFEARKIQITFDEYIVLDNVRQELVVSPPMEEKPEVRLRGKTLIIEFEEELRDSSTYTFNFGSSIKDLHEGNELLNFEYVFSTGNELDSLSVRGILRNAEDLSEPQDPVTIMLYSDLRDSIPLLDIPLYVGKSGDSGVFSVNNLREGTYKLFALKDGNYNLLYDLPTEEIAFLDSSLLLDAVFARSLFEASAADTLNMAVVPPADSIVLLQENDSLLMVRDSLDTGPDFNSVYVDMLLFTEEVEIQYLMEEGRDDRRRIDFVFARPLSDSFSYRFLQERTAAPPRLLEAFSAGRDTLDFWLLDEKDYENDSLVLELTYTVKDTLHQYVMLRDTLLMKYRERVSRKKKTEEEEVEMLELTSVRSKGEKHLNSDLSIDMNFPLGAINDSLIRLFHIPDSIEIPQSYVLREDSLSPLRLWMEVDWTPASAYRLELLPGALQSVYGHTHDTLDVGFNSQDNEVYGKILLSLENVSGPVVVELYKGDKVSKRLRCYSDGDYSLDFLSPGDYSVKFIDDRNDNGRWDTGKYLEGKQPEDVFFFGKKVTVRSNWDHEVKFSF